MRISRHVRRSSGWILSAVIMACGTGDVARDDAAARPAIPLDTVESRGALATRREAQPAFDAARAAIAKKHFGDAGTALADAAEFFQTEARIAETDARPALERVGRELAALATSAARGEVRAPGVLDRAFARAHAAEASLHLTRAHAAIIRRDNVRAGEELLMTVDHVERAAKDARLQTDSLVQAALANARSLAIEMTKGMEAVPDEAARVTDEIDRAIERIVAATEGRAAADSKSGVAPTPCRISPDCVDLSEVVPSSRVHSTETL